MNNFKQDLEVASIEYMLRLMWRNAPFWDVVPYHATRWALDKVYNFLGVVKTTVLYSLS